MTSTDPKIQYLLKQMNEYVASGNKAGVAAAADMLRREMEPGASDGCDCDECDCDDTVESGLVDMVEEAILEDDKDVLIRALSTALMLSSREAEWVELSAVAHSIWVEQ